MGDINHFHRIKLESVGIFAATFTAAMVVVSTGAAAGEHASFADDVLPILQSRCVVCHQPAGDGFLKSGLDLRSYEGLMKGTKFGPIVTPGEAFTSNLNVLIEGRASDKIKMPHGGEKELTRWEKVLIRRWVNRGARNN